MKLWLRTAAFLFSMVSGSFAVTAAPAKLHSVYGKITDGPDCAYEQSATQEDDLMYDCPAPTEGVRTLLHRGDDWDHLYVLIDGKRYSLWEPMVAVGTWSGLGNKNGLVEWLYSDNKRRGRVQLSGLIVRFEGTTLNADGDAAGTRSALAVFNLSAGKLCWVGNFKNNVAARNAAQSGACKAPLTLSESADQG